MTVVFLTQGQRDALIEIANDIIDQRRLIPNGYLTTVSSQGAFADLEFIKAGPDKDDFEVWAHRVEKSPDGRLRATGEAERLF